MATAVGPTRLGKTEAANWQRWKKAREDEHLYHLGRLREVKDILPDRGNLEARFLAVQAYLQDADELLKEIGRVVFEATNRSGSQEVSFDQLGVLYGYLDDLKMMARWFTEHADSIQDAARHDLFIVAQDGQMANTPRYDEHGNPTPWYAQQGQG